MLGLHRVADAGHLAHQLVADVVEGGAEVALVVNAVERRDVGAGVDVDAREVHRGPEDVAAPRAEVRPELGVARGVEAVEPVEADELTRLTGARCRLHTGDEGADGIGRRAVGVGRALDVGLVGHLEDADTRVGPHHVGHPSREPGRVAVVARGRDVLQRQVDGQAPDHEARHERVDRCWDAPVPLDIEVDVEGTAGGQLRHAVDGEVGVRRERVRPAHAHVFADRERVARVDAEVQRDRRRRGPAHGSKGNGGNNNCRHRDAEQPEAHGGDFALGAICPFFGLRYGGEPKHQR